VPFSFHRHSRWLGLLCNAFNTRLWPMREFGLRSTGVALFIGREAIHNGLILRERSRMRQEQNTLEFRERSRIIRPDGAEEKKPVCCSARSQRREEGRPRPSSQHDCRRTQRECSERCIGEMGQKEGIEGRTRCPRLRGKCSC
jgi:hypothetical protein